MMAVIVTSIGLQGLEGYKVSVEVELLDGVESMTIVGLPGAAVKESRERVLAVLKGFDCDFSDQKVIVYLSPAEERKIGPLFDVAIAVAMLRSNGHLKKSIPKDTAFLGSLSLDGSIHTVKGMLPAVISSKRLGIKKLYLPDDCSFPVQQINGIELLYVEHLKDVIDYLSGQPILPLHPRETPTFHQPTYFEGKDFQYIIGHQQAKRALEIAAAGGHNVLMSGPPWCGKSLLLKEPLFVNRSIIFRYYGGSMTEKSSKYH